MLLWWTVRWVDLDLEEPIHRKSAERIDDLLRVGIDLLSIFLYSYPALLPLCREMGKKKLPHLRRLSFGPVHAPILIYKSLAAWDALQTENYLKPQPTVLSDLCVLQLAYCLVKKRGGNHAHIFKTKKHNPLLKLWNSWCLGSDCSCFPRLLFPGNVASHIVIFWAEQLAKDQQVQG